MSTRPVETEDPATGKRSRRKIRQSHNMNVRERLLKGWLIISSKVARKGGLVVNTTGHY